MQFKGTAILLIVFLALGGYVYFAEYRGQEARQLEEESAKKALSIESKDIAEISLVYPDRTITAVRKGEKQWEMTNPAGVEADADEWDTVASNIARIERGETVVAENSDLAPYGLDNPAVTVTARLTGDRTVGVMFGGENPRKTANYARLSDSPEVFLSPVSWKRLLEKNVNDLRNKTLLNFETDHIDAVGIVDAAGREIQLQKLGSEWMLKKPIDAKADNTEVTMFLSMISLAKATGFADPAIDAAAAGLIRPAITLTLHDATEGADRVLLIGRPAASEMFFAKDQSRPPILTVNKDIPEKASRPVLDWRDKAITQLNSDGIEEIEVVREAEKTAFQKSGSEWKLMDGRKLQSDKISSMLNTLEFERALQIIDSPGALSTYGLDRPKLEVYFRQGGKEVLSLKFGADSREPDAGIYLKVSSSPGVMAVSRAVYDKFNIRVDDLVETQSGNPTTQ